MIKFLVFFSMVVVTYATVYGEEPLLEEGHNSYEEPLHVAPVNQYASVQGIAPYVLGHAIQKYTVPHPPHGYPGPHGPGIYDPKFHDILEQRYYHG